MSGWCIGSDRFTVNVLYFISGLLLLHAANIDDHVNWKFLPKDCGKREELIAKVSSGYPAKRGKYPWMVNLFYSDYTHLVSDTKHVVMPHSASCPGFLYVLSAEYAHKRQYPHCAGAILNQNYILTAAHCCDLGGQNPFMIRVGELNLTETRLCKKKKRICENYKQDVEVLDFFMHDNYTVNYRYGWAHNDICLLQLKKSIQFNRYVEPICLPKGDAAKGDLTGKIMEFAGWGRNGKDILSSSLLEAAMKVVSTEECKRKLPKELKHDSETEICVLGEGQKPCSGDSGGPLVYKNSEYRFTVFGIASYSTENVDNECLDSAPVVFTDVRKYRSWILDNIIK